MPIGFFSQKLSEPQTKWSTFDRELFAAYSSAIHFKSKIEGRQVTLFTDHKPLASAFYSTKPSQSDKQQRHLSLLTELVSEVEYIRGDQNIVADCLSRPVSAVMIDFASEGRIHSFPKPFIPSKLEQCTHVWLNRAY